MVDALRAMRNPRGLLPVWYRRIVAAMSSFPVATRGLYAILDPAHVRGRDPLAVAEEVLEGGAAVLQLRAKTLADRELLALASEVRLLCNRAGVPFVVNDRADVARLVDADGLHLGQDDLPLLAARRVVGSMPIGRSTHSIRQALMAASEGSDLIGFGPVYATGTKENADPVVGVAELAEVVRAVSIPVVAIGGITAARMPEVLRTGVPLVAMISAVIGADDPRSAARALHQLASGGR